ncbi:MAG: ATP-binding protein [Treponema sp.]|nr:ATP-binding protein [Treponema sp.]MDY5817071.1 ATP-binding protein [Treponema sp.]
MNGIERDLKAVLDSKIGKGKVLLLIGPRQVGKTTLLKNILTSISSEKKVQFWNCDESDVRQFLSEANSAKLKSFVGNSDFIVIDEAQRVKDIGLTIKLLHDSFPNVQLAVTGSSSLDLSNSINEPLTGRKFEYNLFPFSTNELVNHTSMLEEMRLLKNRLVYGFYPDVVNNPGEEKEILTNIVNSYLYKDVFEFQDIRKSSVIEKLVQALALQVGSEVSFNELGNLLGIDTVTVQRYVDLLEKSYVIFHIRSFSRNVRNELKKSIKIYFYDNGVRNSVISNFSPVELRSDIGALWENFLISERIKNNAYHNKHAKYYFWRTTQKQEIDFIEEVDQNLFAYEFKYNPKKVNSKCPVTFSNNYPNVPFEVITSENYMDFVVHEE